MHLGECQFDYLANMHFDACQFDYLAKHAFWHMPIWLFS